MILRQTDIDKRCLIFTVLVRLLVNIDLIKATFAAHIIALQ